MWQGRRRAAARGDCMRLADCLRLAEDEVPVLRARHADIDQIVVGDDSEELLERHVLGFQEGCRAPRVVGRHADEGQEGSNGLVLRVVRESGLAQGATRA